MKQPKMLLVTLLMLLFKFAISQVGVNIFNPDPSAELDLYSDSKGFLMPRVSLSSDLYNASPVNSPVESLLIYNNGINHIQGFYYWTGSYWSLLKTETGNTISGPSSSTDNAVVRFHGTTGKVIQNSGVLLNDSDQMSMINNITTTEFQLTTTPSIGKLLVSDNSGNASWETAPPIDVEEDDILITPNVSTLNFKGNLNVYEISDYKATVRVYKNNVTNDVIQVSCMDSLDLNNLTTYELLQWNSVEHKDAATFIHNDTLNPSRIQVRTKGIYEVNFMFSIINKTIMRKTLRTRLLKNGVEIIPHVTSYSFSYNMEDDKVSHVSSSFLIQLEASDYVELIVNGQTNPGPVLLIPDENLFFMRLMRAL